MKRALMGFSVVLLAIVFVFRPGRAAEPSAKQARPKVIYITDFVLDMAQMGGQRPHLLRRPAMMQEDPEAKRHKLIEAMSNALTEDLRSKSFQARRLHPGNPQPHTGWLVRGRFLDADQGNRAVRSVVGFGAGSTDMRVEVSVFDLGRSSREPIAVFGAKSKSGRGPGAIVTKNPYVLAAKFVMSKRHPERDVQKTAKQIAGVLEKMAGEAGGH